MYVGDTLIWGQDNILILPYDLEFKILRGSYLPGCFATISISLTAMFFLKVHYIKNKTQNSGLVAILCMPTFSYPK